MRLCTIFVFLCSFISSGLALADSGALSANDWGVQSSSGDVFTTPGGTDGQRRLETGQLLTAPFSIRTGPTGQVTLVRGDDAVLVSPGSELEVQAATQSEAGLVTRILQSIGSLVYQVEKRAKQRFEVETPYLVSVVKGTTFTISVTKRDAVVSLQEGSLEILGIDGSHRALMEPGEIARTIQGARGIEVINAVPQRSQWGSWHPANAKIDAGDSAKSGLHVARTHAPARTKHSPDRSDSAPGKKHTPHGQSRTPHGISQVSPGVSRTPPGRSRISSEFSRTPPVRSRIPPVVRSLTAPGLSRTPPGLSRTPPGRNK